MKIDLHFLCHNEGWQLIQMLNSVQPVGFDRIVAVLTQPIPSTRAILEEYGCDIVEFVWCDNFSAARNAGLRRCTGDLVVWLDADDVLIHPEAVRPFCENLFQGDFFNMLAVPYDYHDDGNLKFYRERIVKRETHEWMGWVHENLVCNEKLSGARTPCFHVRHDAVVTDRQERNLKISMAEYKAEKTPRSTRNLGQSLLAYGAFATAKKYLTEYLDEPEDDEGHPYAISMLCDACAHLKDWDGEEKYGHLMIQVAPDVPIGYYRVAHAIKKKGDPVTAMEWAKKGDLKSFESSLAGYNIAAYRALRERIGE